MMRIIVRTIRQYSHLIVLWFLCAQVVLISSVEAEVSDYVGEETFVWLSDIHFDSLFGEDESNGGPQCRNLDVLDPAHDIMLSMGCECNDALLNEVLTFASAFGSRNKPPSMVIVSGDLVRHGMDRVKKDPLDLYLDTISTVSKAVRDYFKADIPIVFALGNNDLFPHYKLDSSILKSVEGRLHNSFSLTEHQSKTFGTQGYLTYDMMLPTGDLTILSLNTNMFSNKLITDDGTQTFNPENQWTWMESELQRCRLESRHVWILGHIPPTIQSYSKGSPLWLNSHVDRYRSILEEYKGIIQTQLFAHLHSTEFRFFPHDNDNNSDDSKNEQQEEHSNSNFKYITGVSPLWITSSVSPIFEGLPGYQTVTFNLNEPHALIDFHPHVFNLTDNTWFHPPSLKEAYGNLPDLSIATLQEHIVKPILSASSDNSIPVFRTFMSRYKYRAHHQSYNNVCDTLSCRVPWGCTMISNTPQEYQHCLDIHMPTSSSPSRIAAAIMTGILICMLASVSFFTIKYKLKDSRKKESIPIIGRDENLWSCRLDEDEEISYGTVTTKIDKEKTLPRIT